MFGARVAPWWLRNIPLIRRALRRACCMLHVAYIDAAVCNLRVVCCGCTWQNAGCVFHRSPQQVILATRVVSAEHDTLKQRTLHVARCTCCRSNTSKKGLLEGTRGYSRVLKGYSRVLEGTRGLLEGTQGLLEGAKTCCLTTIYGVCSSRSRGCAGMTCTVPGCGIVSQADVHTRAGVRVCRTVRVCRAVRVSVCVCVHV